MNVVDVYPPNVTATHSHIFGLAPHWASTSTCLGLPAASRPGRGPTCHTVTVMIYTKGKGIGEPGAVPV